MRKHHNSMFLGAIVAISSLLPGQAFAEARASIHPDLRGIWAIGSCAGTGEGLLIIRGTMVMTIEEGDATAQRLVTDQASDENGWIPGRFEDDATPLFLRRVPGRPDVLELTGPTTDPDDASGATRPGPTPDPVIWEMLQFEGCSELPPGPQALYGELLAVLDGIDVAEAACIQEPGECARALFAIADVHQDGVLTIAEISRMLRVLVQLGAIEQGNGEIDKQLGMLAASVPLAPILARALVSSFDYDGDNAISLEEILQDRIGSPPSNMSVVLSGAEARVSDLMNSLESRASDLGRLLMMLR